MVAIPSRKSRAGRFIREAALAGVFYYDAEMRQFAQDHQLDLSDADYFDGFVAHAVNIGRLTKTWTCEVECLDIGIKFFSDFAQQVATRE